MQSPQSSLIARISRIFLGLAFFVFGLNGFLGFMPQPAVPEAAGAMLGAFAASGYMFPLIKGTEVVVGLLLLSNRFVPLALTLLAPITVNIVAFHLFLAPAGMAAPLVLTALQLYLAYVYRESYRGVLQSHAQTVAAQAKPRFDHAHV